MGNIIFEIVILDKEIKDIDEETKKCPRGWKINNLRFNE